MIVDITERKLAEARAQHYLDVAGTILLVLRTDQTVELLNRHGRELLGYEDGELIGTRLVRRRRPRGRPRAAPRQLHRACWPAATTAVHLPPGRRRHPRTGERRTIAWRNTHAARRRGRGHGHPASGEDITERLRAEEQISRLAYYDPLTGLPNRALLEARARRCVTRARRAGRAVGAAATSTSTTSSSSTTRSATAPATGCCAGSPARLRGSSARGSGDLLARPGRRRVPDPAARPRRRRRGGRPRGAPRRSWPRAGRAVQGLRRRVPRRTRSIGISLYPDDAPAPDELLQHADTAMYQARAAARAASTVYARRRPRPAGAPVAAGAAAPRDRARRAASCTTSRSSSSQTAGSPSMEALLRWNDPDRGLVRPTSSSPPPRRRA